MRHDPARLPPSCLLHRGFNPHAYVRHDSYKNQIVELQKEFQSTCLREAWRHIRVQTEGLKSFNPHAYVRHDIDMEMFVMRMPSFNPHAYVRHDFLVKVNSGKALPFQSTCLREAWLYVRRRKYINTFVSIHMPTWGMTTGRVIPTHKTCARFQSTCLREAWP